jgi:hypothetical protein
MFHVVSLCQWLFCLCRSGWISLRTPNWQIHVVVLAGFSVNAAWLLLTLVRALRTRNVPRVVWGLLLSVVGATAARIVQAAYHGCGEHNVPIWASFTACLLSYPPVVILWMIKESSRGDQRAGGKYYRKLTSMIAGVLVSGVFTSAASALSQSRWQLACAIVGVCFGLLTYVYVLGDLYTDLTSGKPGNSNNPFCVCARAS